MDLSALGQRIRDERVRRGISVRGLARDVGVSASMISQIETAKSQPSVSTLYAITSALGISIEDVFAPPDANAAPAPVSVSTAAVENGRPTSVQAVLDSIRGRRRGPIVHPDERQILT